jgi:hypothetical protein
MSNDPRPGRDRGPLRRAWSDLAAGSNVEIYATTLVSLVLALLSVFDVVAPPVVAAATLATLALLALSTLGSRHQVQDLRRSIDTLTAAVNNAIPDDLPVHRFLAVKAPDLHDELRGADDIRLVGVTLGRTVRDLARSIERRLRAGATVRVVVIDPDGPAPLDAIERTLGVTSPDLYRPRIKSTIEMLDNLAAESGGTGQIEVRLLPFVPAFGMYLIDPDEPDGRTYVEIYQHRSREPNPCFQLKAERDGHWYKFFANQFDVLWDSARPAPDPASGLPHG